MSEDKVDKVREIADYYKWDVFLPDHPNGSDDIPGIVMGDRKFIKSVCKPGIPGTVVEYVPDNVRNLRY